MRLRAINRPCSCCCGIACALLCACLLVCLQTIKAGGRLVSSNKRAIRYDDLPSQLYSWLDQQSIRRESFTARIAAINQMTDERELRGEYDHLIFYLLQSSRFTALPKIEPALSAYEFAQGLSEQERMQFLAGNTISLPPNGRIPRAVNTRIADFIKAASKQNNDERLRYFAELLDKTVSPAVARGAYLQTEYARAMSFLYRKEFEARTVKREESATFVASLYQDRGHSTDTQIEANFAVHTALAALKAQSPETKINRVLIVGPGLDFAPRTDLIDLFGPQSYQPFAVADALIGLNLAGPAQLQIHCVDINDRVIAHLQNLGRRKQVSLSLLSGIKESTARPLTGDYKQYFRDFGQNIGAQSPLEVPAQFTAHLSKSLVIRPEIVKTIRAERLNIITERYQESPRYDLVIVTNVFPYFSAPELLFALSNISAMMADGGHLIHNDLQSVPTQFIAPLGLPLQQARTVLIADEKTSPLFDGVAIHQKVNP